MNISRKLTALLLALCLLLTSGIACAAPDLAAEDPHYYALVLGEKAIGKTAWVVEGGNLRAEPSPGSKVLSEVYTGDRFAILDTRLVSQEPLNVWLKIDFCGLEGWISASLALIVDEPADDYTPGGDPELEVALNRYVGQDICIVSTGANVRAGAGAQYKLMGKVYRGQVFTVSDCAFASTGVLWYEINVDGVTCWVSKAMTTLLQH